MEQTATLAKSELKPTVVEDVTLISPGVWTGTDNHPTNYSAETILKGFENTTWENMNLFLDHQDTKARGVSNWAGFIKNPRMVGSELHGDLEVWHPMISMFIKEAKAKFGVSMTTQGVEKMLSEDLYDYDIDNFTSFSIVDDPACKISWINKALSSNSNTKTIISGFVETKSKKELAQDINIIESEKEVKKMEEKDQKEESKEEESEEEVDKEEKEVDKELRKAKLELKKKELKSIKKQLQESDEDEEEEKPSEETSEESKEESKEESEDKPEEKPEEKSEEKPSEETSEESKEESESDKELAKVKKELAALKEKDNSPDRKSLSVGGNAPGVSDENSINLGMLGFLRENANLNY